MIGLKTLQAQAGRQLPLMLPIVANSWLLNRRLICANRWLLNRWLIVAYRWLLNRWQTNQGSAGENSFFNFVFQIRKSKGGTLLGIEKGTPE